MATHELVVRWTEVPPVEGCRWCGFPKREHGKRWAGSKKWHSYCPPTSAQIHARIRARWKKRLAWALMNLKEGVE